MTHEEKKARQRIAQAKYRAAHRDQCEAYDRAYKEANRDVLKARSRAYHARHKEEARVRSAAYRAANRERLLERNREYAKEHPEMHRTYRRQRRAQDPEFKLLTNTRSRIWDVLKRSRKSAHTRELLGCTFAQFKAHLESQFQPGMTWENYGPAWHVDHRKPCASFDLTDPAQQRECFHYTNLQPLFAEDNLKKGANESQ